MEFGQTRIMTPKINFKGINRKLLRFKGKFMENKSHKSLSKMAILKLLEVNNGGI